MTQFSDFGLAEVLLRALAHEGYTTPTPIQAQSIPALMKGRDLLGIAQTGTGKTAAFALPILHKLIAENVRPQPKAVRALVLAPTRELAAQIADSFKAYGRFAKMSVGVVVGGVSAGPQIQALARGLDVLVATPGRLLDHLQSGHVKLDTTRIVVLDEADHMLDLGFIKPIKQIVAKLPRERQNLFFSATMPGEISGLASDLLKDPLRVSVTPVATTAERVEQLAYLVDGTVKRDLLVELLKRPDYTRTIVFTRTKRGANKVTDYLEAASISAVAIHGNKSQGQRQRALDAFKGGSARVLVATDIAARGIDVDGVTHVINFELPDVAESYVHRIGRTARAGREGAAVSLVDITERGLLKQIERLTRQTIPLVDRRGDKPVRAVDPAKLAEAEMRSRAEQMPHRRETAKHPGFAKAKVQGRPGNGGGARGPAPQGRGGKPAGGNGAQHQGQRPAAAAQGRPNRRPAARPQA